MRLDTLLSHLFRDPYPEPKPSRGNEGREPRVDMKVGASQAILRDVFCPYLYLMVT